MFLLRKKLDLVTGDGIEYRVRAEDSKYNLTFDIREHARLYKRGLKLSKAQMSARIFRCEYNDGFVDEVEIS